MGFSGSRLGHPHHWWQHYRVRGLPPGSFERIETLLVGQDFASGTSLKSSKLVHGVIRYLRSRQYDEANLYFIFIAKMDTIKEYLDLQYGILEAMIQIGAAISHHHGIGKQTASWLEQQIGHEQMELIRVLKQHFDPHNILNPGGTLGLDMSPAQAEKRWSKDLEQS